MVSQVAGSNGLRWLERLMEASATPPVSPASFPPSRFHCRLADQPNHLLPLAYLAGETLPGPADRALRVNPDTCFTRDHELPKSLAGSASLLENFALRGPIAWVPDPASHVLQPFWLEPEWAAALIDPSTADPTALEPRVRRLLAMANILTSDKSTSRRQDDDWGAGAARLAGQFQEKGYAPAGGLIHPLHIAALRRYYRQQIRTGKLVLGDFQSTRRYVAHNESVARFFHHQLTTLVGAVVGEAVKPSYVYLAAYQGGAKLEKHTDREQCEFSVTLCLDYSPEPQRQTPWPIHLHTQKGRVTVFQSIGDGLIYRGRELPHSRDPLPREHTSTSIFFHYVRDNFSGALD